MKKRMTISLAFALIGIFTANAQTPEQLAIEVSYLEKANQNIERYRKGNAVILFCDKAGNPVQNIKVSINQYSQDFLFGALSEEMFKPGVNSSDAADLKNKFKELFNFTILTFKWAPFEPEQGKPQWQNHEPALAWYKENNITVKGHTLGWTHHAGTPPWLYTLSPQVVNELYKARIYNIVAGYKSQIKIWDVINEPVTTIPWERALRDTVKGKGEIDSGIRYDVKGITLKETIPWIEKSYRWADQANGDAHFILNEFYTLAKPDVREKFFKLAKELKKRGVPLDGLGIQAHEPRNMWFSPIEFYKTLDQFSTLGLPIHITEFIPQSSGKIITGWRSGKWTEDAQAEFAEQFYTLAFGHPSIASFNWWGFSDRDSWLEGGGLLDQNNNPKPVYTRLKNLLKERWMTKNLYVQSDSNGKVEFRGFYGKYEITVNKPNGLGEVMSIHLKEKGMNEFRMVIRE